MKTKQQSYPELAKALGTSDVFLKREDLHPFGSHKGRSIPVMVKEYVKQGVRKFVISSSGNAALAAIRAAVRQNKNNPDKQITLQVFVGKKIDQKKFDGLKKEVLGDGITIEQVEKPKQLAFQLGKEEGVVFLRQSTDELALVGYETLAQDLAKIPDLAAVFVSTSSGTCAQGMAEAFARMEKDVQMHIVQTTAHHPIAESFDAPEAKTETSIAGAIVDNIAHRKQAVVDIVKQSGGHGWIVTDEQITNARKLVQQTTDIHISSNSALAVAGIKKAAENGWSWNGPVVAIISGQ